MHIAPPASGDLLVSAAGGGAPHTHSGWAVTHTHIQLAAELASEIATAASPAVFDPKLVTKGKKSSYGLYFFSLFFSLSFAFDPM